MRCIYASKFQDTNDMSGAAFLKLHSGALITVSCYGWLFPGEAFAHNVQLQGRVSCLQLFPAHSNLRCGIRQTKIILLSFFLKIGQHLVYLKRHWKQPSDTKSLMIKSSCCVEP